MRFRFLSPAAEEMAEAVAHYDGQRHGLGAEFADEVESAIGVIRDHPHAWPKLSKNTRRCRTKRFPYGVVYTVRGDEIVIVAVMHLHREPGYWEGRM